MPKPGALWVLRHSVTGTCQTEKLWHPLLFKRFRDAGCLHRPVVMTRKWGRRSAWQSGSRRNEKKKWLLSQILGPYRAPMVFPIGMILITGILQFNMKQRLENSKKMFLQLCLLFRFWGDDLPKLCQNNLSVAHIQTMPCIFCQVTGSTLCTYC